jgi:hypothetical protein
VAGERCTKSSRTSSAPSRSRSSERAHLRSCVTSSNWIKSGRGGDGDQRGGARRKPGDPPGASIRDSVLRRPLDICT